MIMVKFHTKVFISLQPYSDCITSSTMTSFNIKMLLPGKPTDVVYVVIVLVYKGFYL